MRAVYVLTTGGTIEKVYCENAGSVANLESKIDRYLRVLLLSDCQVNVVPVMNKDSSEMTDGWRKRPGEYPTLSRPRSDPCILFTRPVTGPCHNNVILNVTNRGKMPA